MMIKLINKERQLVGEIEEMAGDEFFQGLVVQATNKSLFVVVERIATDIKGAITLVVEPLRLTR